jgi:DNA polymerase V
MYSIDECFPDPDRLAVADLTEWCRDLRQTTLQWTGIPVSVGVDPTKTLAKLANRLAKKSSKARGVLDLVHQPNWIEAALRKTPIDDVWGVGRRWSAMLEERRIRTAHDLASAQDGWVRQRMGVVGLRTVHELRGHVCHALDDQPPPKQTTCCSRTFGTAIYDKGQVHDAVMSFAERAAEKVRHAGQVAGAVQLFIRTDPFVQDIPQKSASGSATFHRPTSDTRDITEVVLRIFERTWRDGYGWRKAGVLLLDFAAPGAASASLFVVMEAPDDGLMQAIDRIDDRYGRGTARLGLAQKDAEWRMRRENLSPSFTTRWGGISRRQRWVDNGPPLISVLTIQPQTIQLGFGLGHSISYHRAAKIRNLENCPS